MKTLIFGLLILLSAQSFSQNKLKLMQKDGKMGYINEKLEFKIKPVYDFAMDFNTYGIAAVVDKKGWLYIDTAGKEILRPFIYDNGPDYFQEGLARYVEKNKVGFFDESGKIVIPAKFDFVEPFSNGYANFCKGCVLHQDDEHHRYVGGEWGIINKKGEMITQPEYYKIERFQNGRFRVLKGKKWFYLNEKGEEIK